MNQDLVLRRAQVLTVVFGAVAAGALALGRHPEIAKGLGVGSLWAAANLVVLEGLMRAAFMPRDRVRSVPRITIWFLLKMAVYVVAVWLLIVAPFPVVGMAHGLTVMLTALVVSGLTTRSAPPKNVSRRGDDAHA
ncbi:MAG: hypothetical protein R3D98_15695 [Candidatus Krumholzibacteriia bacterium]